VNAKHELQADALAKHIHALLQMPVTVQRAAAQDLRGGMVRAELADETGRLSCVVLADTAAAGSTGAALSRIPAGAVADVVRRGQPLDEDMLANFHEIANVLTVLTTALLERRTILRGVTQGAQVTTQEEWVRSALHRAFFRVSVQSYPAGVLGFYWL
jgi:hypothetical protein